MKNENFAKKSLSAILMVAMLLGILAMFPITAGAAPVTDTSKGSQSNPILIHTEDELKALKETIVALSAKKKNPSLVTYYVELTGDIDFEGRTMPDLDLEAYTVSFEGGNHTVSNFKAEYALFGALGQNSTVQNLNVKGATISAPSGGAGAIVGTVFDGFAAINCSVDETTTVTNRGNGPTGGLVGQARDSAANTDIYFTDCTNRATVTTAGGNLGGIIGQVNNSYVHLYFDTCENRGVLVGGAHTGGLVGSASNILKLRLNECENSADITTASGYAGGLVGYAKCLASSTETWTVSYSKNTGNVSAATVAGGIIGYSEGSPAYKVSYTANTGNVTTTLRADGTSAVGGILGYQAKNSTQRTASFTYCYNEGTLTNANAGTSSAYVGTGGIVGYFDATGCSTVTLKSCYDFGGRAVTSGSYNANGIIVGFLKNGTTMNVTSCQGTAKGGVSAFVGTFSTDGNTTVASKAEIASTMTTLEREVMLRRPKGDGSEANPYLVGTDMQLQYLAKHIGFDNVTYIEITNNIDFGGYHLQIEFQDGREYVARPVHVNGNGYTISNYTSHTGIFERIGGGSTIKNLHVANATITKPNNGTNRHAGAIVGYVEGDFTMTGCSAAANVTVTQNLSANTAGGLVGSVEGKNAYMLFVDCSSAATVTGNNAVAGILGKIYSPDAQLVFMNCISTATLSTSGDSTLKGGIVGYLHKGAIVDFYNCESTGAAVCGKVNSGITATTHTMGTADLRSKSATKNLTIRMKLTDDFGLMAITEITENGKSASLEDYEYGFYFLESNERVTPEQIKASGKKVEGAPYGTSTSVFCAAYTEMKAATLYNSHTLHLMAYAKDGAGNETLGSIRTVDMMDMLEDLTDGKVGAATVTKNKLEMAIYRNILNYADTYNLYLNTELNIGVFNLGQNYKDKTAVTNDYVNSQVSVVEQNLDAFANAMYTLGLDVIGLNECDVYRGSSSYGGGYHTPWEIAQRMEALTGEEYYWAFATALNEESKFSNGSSVRPFYNRYAAQGIEGPDGLYRSGDNLLKGGYATHSGYGEGLVSKYPIVSVQERIIDVAKYLDEYGTAAEKEFYKNYNESYQYDPATGYERRVVLVATLDVDGSYVTVMVTHWDHTGYPIEGTTNTFPRLAATRTCIEAIEEYSDRPTFLMGDLNVTRNGPYIRDLDKVLNRAGDDNMTATNPNSGEKIDHIYYNDYSNLISYKVETRNEASDHLLAHVTVRFSDFKSPSSPLPAAPNLLETTLPLSLQPTSSYLAGDGATTLIYEGVSEAFLEEYKTALAAHNFSLYSQTDFSGSPSASYSGKGSSSTVNRFATYISGDNSVDLQYHAYGYLDSHALKEADSSKPAFGNKFAGGILFATISPRAGLTLPRQSAPDYQALDSNQYPTIVTQVGLDDHHQRLTSNCYIIRLADGSFIIHDSGYGNKDANNKTVGDKIYDILYKQAPDKNNIVIAAWISSHPHADHVDGLTQFASKYASYPNVTVKQFVHNFGDDSIIDAGNSLLRKREVQAAMKKFPNATFVKPHTGNVLYYANVKFNIVYTQENYLQLCGNAGFDGNSATMIMQMETDKGMKVLFGGDSAQMDHYNGTAPFTFNAIAKRYGTFLNSNVMTYFHHGLGGGSSWEANEAIAPEIVLWPTSFGKIEDAKTGGTDLMESSHSIYFTRKNRYNLIGNNRFTEGVLNASANYAGVYGYFIADNNIHIVNLDKEYKTGVPTVTTYDTHAAYFNS